MTDTNNNHQEDFILDWIRNQIYNQNRNFTALIQGKVGKGKSWSALSCCELLDPNFTSDNIFFFTSDILEGVYKNKFTKGNAILFDEAGIDASNRKSYMNKFNVAMSFLLQTWRDKNLILFVTVPESLFIDAGIRRLFDVHIECMRVNKSRKTVSTKWKTTKVNYQTGKVYYTRIRDKDGAILNIEVPKPSDKLIEEYKPKKEKFQIDLYKQQWEKLNDNEQNKFNDSNDNNKIYEKDGIKYEKQIDKYGETYFAHIKDGKINRNYTIKESDFQND